MKKSKVLTLKITEDLKKKLENIAKAEDRSVSYVVHKALEREVKKSKKR